MSTRPLECGYCGLDHPSAESCGEARQRLLAPAPNKRTPKPIAVLPLAVDYADRDRMTLGFSCSFPWLRTTTPVRPDAEAAYADAVAWAKEYEAADRWGNMANALGVAARGDGFVGVVNYFHSNT